MRTVLGQRLHQDAPWRCAFCNQRYVKRHLLLLWEDYVNPRTHAVTATRLHKVRLCADTDTSCGPMGLSRLLRRFRRVEA